MVYRVTDLFGLLPRNCLLCGDAAHEQLDLCAPCRADLPWHTTACRRCAMPLPAPEAALCARCLRQPPPLASTLAALRYEYPVAELLARFKFSGNQAVGRLLAELLLERLRQVPTAFADKPLLLPVPLHVHRLRERGFNQSLGIARLLARRLRLPLRQDLLSKTTSGADQKQLGAAERRANLRGAFRAGDCTGLRIALVDDVVTTGATAETIATALLRRGARDVRLWCIARAI